MDDTALLNALAERPDLLRNAVLAYKWMGKDNAQRHAELRRAAHAVLEGAAPETCPYEQGTDACRHWLDGWNWFVEGKRRAAPPPAFSEGYDAGAMYFAKHGKIERRGGY